MYNTINEKVSSAFYRDAPLSVGNTTITKFEGRILFILYGHTIAVKDIEYGTLTLDTCGYPTRTTISRLNLIDGVNVYTRKGKLYLNGKEWDGEKVKLAIK